MDADRLVRIAGNVAHVHKKNPTIRSVMMTLTPDNVLTVLGGDPYAAAFDSAPVQPAAGFKASRGAVTEMEIPREGLDAITSFCRQHPKEDVVLSWFPGDGLVLQAGAARESVEDAAGMTPPAAWRGLRELFDRYEDPASMFILDTALASRFRLVKSDTNERRADWMIRDPEEPILLKVGPTFRGLMVPIKRERHAEAVGQDGLW
ncbi:MAG: hypothetical protein HOY79_28895 [Streptomyces sp.]|nr:hypothetical protein [Streptomyces sp.]